MTTQRTVRVGDAPTPCSEASFAAFWHLKTLRRTDFQLKTKLPNNLIGRP